MDLFFFMFFLCLDLFAVNFVCLQTKRNELVPLASGKLMPLSAVMVHISIYRMKLAQFISTSIMVMFTVNTFGNFSVQVSINGMLTSITACKFAST